MTREQAKKVKVGDRVRYINRDSCTMVVGVYTVVELFEGSIVVNTDGAVPRFREWCCEYENIALCSPTFIEGD